MDDESVKLCDRETRRSIDLLEVDEISLEIDRGERERERGVGKWSLRTALLQASVHTESLPSNRNIISPAFKQVGHASAPLAAVRTAPRNCIAIPESRSLLSLLLINLENSTHRTFSNYFSRCESLYLAAIRIVGFFTRGVKILSYPSIVFLSFHPM